MNSPRFFCTIALTLCIQTAVQAQVSVTPTQPIQEDVDLTVEDSQTATVEATGFQTVTYEGVNLEVVKAAVNPANGELAIALERNPVVIWDAEAQSIVREFADIHLEWESVVYSPDGRFLAGGTYDGTVVLYDSATGQAIHTLTVGVPARNLSFNDDSSKVVISGQYILDTADFALTPLNEAYAVCMGIGGAFLPKSNHLFTIGFNNYCVWDTTDFSVTAQSNNSVYTDGAYTAIAASPNGEAVVISSKPVIQPDTLILDPEGQVKHHLALGQSSTGFGEVHFSADGSTVALTSGGLESSGKEVVILEPLSGKVLKRYDETNLQTPLQYSIYGSVVISPRTLLLVHNNAGLNFIDITQETNAAITVREEELARVAAIPEVEQSAPVTVNDEVTEDEADVQPPAVPETNDSQVDDESFSHAPSADDNAFSNSASGGSTELVLELEEQETVPEPQQQENQLPGVVEAFGKDSLHGNYINTMLDNQSAVEIKCSELVEVLINVNRVNYVCVSASDINKVLLAEDIDGFLATNEQGVDSISEWSETEIGFPVKYIKFTNNYQVAITDISAANFFLISGGAETPRIQGRDEETTQQQLEPTRGVKQKRLRNGKPQQNQLTTPDFAGMKQIRENAIYDFVNLRRNELGMGYEFYTNVNSSRLYEDICPSGYATVWYTASSANRPLLFNFYGEVHPEETKYLVFTADIYEPVASPAIAASCIYDQPQKVYRELHRLFVYTSYFDESMLNCEIMVNNDGKKTLWDRQNDPKYATCEGDRNFYR